ncbi:hypothetical protein RF11_04174 [Thelohanellus kitauei]|uniref:Reverse transcriptase domain-containing protein n=1 Tax=Thelohanellus kitauei TaxID=669202 RepID=A0A0C2J2Z6_THEKT|nr:hypothetical protein RF11_04174 [Thelohanellus kitauei]
MDIQFKEDEPINSHMPIVENLAILKKWTNGQTLSQVTLATPDNLRLEFAKMHDEMKVFKTLAINLMDENRRVDSNEELTSRGSVMGGDMLKNSSLKKHPSEKLDRSRAHSINSEGISSHSLIAATKQGTQNDKLDDILDILRSLGSENTNKRTIHLSDQELTRVCRDRMRRNFRGLDHINTVEEPITIKDHIDDEDRQDIYDGLIDTGANKTLIDFNLVHKFNKLYYYFAVNGASGKVEVHIEPLSRSFPKNDNSRRFAIDYRKLKNNISQDSYLLHNIQLLIDRLGRTSIFSQLDLKNAYWQMPFAEGDKHKTAFSAGPGWGIYDFNGMQLGLNNTPATFQSIIDQILSEFPFVCAYIHDFVPFSNSFDEHKTHLKKTKEIDLFCYSRNGFTKWVKEFANPDQTSLPVNGCNLQIISRFCVPKLHSDQGPNFESETIKMLCSEWGIKKTRSITERNVKTLKPRIKQIAENNYTRWDEKLPEILFSMRTHNFKIDWICSHVFSIQKETTISN